MLKQSSVVVSRALLALMLAGAANRKDAASIPTIAVTCAALVRWQARRGL